MKKIGKLNNDFKISTWDSQRKWPLCPILSYLMRSTLSSPPFEVNGLKSHCCPFPKIQKSKLLLAHGCAPRPRPTRFSGWNPRGWAATEIWNPTASPTDSPAVTTRSPCRRGFLWHPRRVLLLPPRRFLLCNPQSPASHPFRFSAFFFCWSWLLHLCFLSLDWFSTYNISVKYISLLVLNVISLIIAYMIQG